MKNLYSLASECMKELDALNIPYGTITDFKINTRAKSRWGQCSYNRVYDKYTIEVAAVLLEDNVSDMATKDTIMHELIHTCPNCMNHGTPWQSVANKVNKAYGYNLKRTASVQEKGVSLKTAEDFHYIIHCEGCGASWKYMRYSKIVKSAEANTARCGCGCKRFYVEHL